MRTVSSLTASGINPTAARRRVYVVGSIVWLVIGMVGVHGYLHDYADHRGFAPVKRLRGQRAGETRWMHFFSPALGRKADYLVYLPAGFTRSQRYPVFYLLHGSPGRPQDFIDITGINVRLDNLIARRRVQPMILVFPDGRIKGRRFSDSEWANTRSGRYEDYVLNVVANVDASLPVIADRAGRVIGGLSSGSLGAINIALHHPELFASMQGWSGPFAESRSGPFKHASAASIRAWSPLDYASRLGSEVARYPMQAFLYGGRQDRWSRKLPAMAAALERSGVRVQWKFYSGGHDWELWDAQVNHMLTVAGDFFAHPPSKQSRGALGGASARPGARSEGLHARG